MSADSGSSGGSLERRALVALQRLQAELDEERRARTEPIAVIGMACRFPGGADTPEAFWQLIAEGRDAAGPVPADRYDVDAFYDPDPDAVGTLATREGSFVDRIDGFDPLFFGISPREAAFLDPQQRMLLEVTWEALERAGIPADALAGSQAGVFVGIMGRDYYELETLAALENGGASINAYSATGGAAAFAPGRISYLLGTHGPSLVVDTACSSSLVALHLACQSLRAGESDLALVGGVSLGISPYPVIAVSKLHALSPDGRSRAMDASAAGFGRGEGCGVVVLKRLSHAEADGDQVLALIRGSAVNHDGRSSGLTAPNGLAQQAVIRRALANAEVAPELVGYIETHGTGTPLGDPIEFDALKAVFGAPRADGSACVLSSVKTNIGHLEPAAGIASVIKTVLALQHGEIPGNANFVALNPHISLQGTPFVIARSMQAWPCPPGSRGRRLAGVSGAGLSGTNAHIVLEEAPHDDAGEMPDAAAAGAAVAGLESTGTSAGARDERRLVTLSARDATALSQLADAWLRALEPGGSLAASPLGDIAWTGAVRRTQHPVRAAAVVTTRDDLRERLRAIAAGPGPAGGAAAGEAATTGGVEGAAAIGPAEPLLDPVFVYSGQGAQWPGMGLALMERSPIARDTIEACADALRPFTGWSLIDELRAPPERSRLTATEVAQPAIFAIGIALTALWQSRGVTPGAVVGHSVGEITAAFTAGVLSLREAARLVAARGRLMQQAHGRGAMAVVELPVDDVTPLLAGSGDAVAIAAINSPTSVVISGEREALELVLGAAERAGAFCRRMAVDYAFHSAQVEPFRAPLVHELRDLEPRRASVPLVSTVTGGLADGDDWDAAYWGRNLREPVRFGDAIATLARLGYRAFLELSAQPVLARNMRQSLGAATPPPLVLPSLRRGVPDDEVLLTSLGALWTARHRVRLASLFPASEGAHRIAPLPTYPWQRRRYWFGTERPRPLTVALRRDGPASRATGHPLLGDALRTPGPSELFAGTIAEDVPAWVADHRVSGAAVVPAAALIELFLASAVQVHRRDQVQLADLVIREPLTIPPDGKRLVEVMVGPAASDGRRTAELLSCPADEQDADDAWTRHATAEILPAAPDAEASHEGSGTALARLAGREGDGGGALIHAHYERMAAVGVQYGPAFRGLRELASVDGRPVGRVVLPDVPDATAAGYVVHPALLDACFQVLAAARPEAAAGGALYLPFSAERIEVHRRPGREVWCEIRMATDASAANGALAAGGGGVPAGGAGATGGAAAAAGPATPGSSLVADVRITDDAGRLIATVTQLQLLRVSPEAFSGLAADPMAGWFYEPRWERLPEPAAAASAGSVAVPGSPRPAPAGRGPHPPGSAGAAWLLIADSGGIAEGLAMRLRTEGEACVVVRQGERYRADDSDICEADLRNPEQVRRLLTDRFAGDGTPRGIVALSLLDVATAPAADGHSLLTGQELPSRQLLALARERGEMPRQPPLWVVTRGSQRVVDADASTTPDPAQAPGWGLAWAMALEQTGARTTCVDVDPAASRDALLEQLLHELRTADAEDQVAWRGTGRHGRRLARARIPVPPTGRADTSARLRADGSYLVTGGLGGLGLRVAAWMADHGAGELILVGRNVPTAAQQEAIDDLRRSGAGVRVIAADVADAAAVERLVAMIRAESAPLRGILHAAGIVDDGMLQGQTWERMAAVLAPKVAGAWNLHLASRDLPLESFVLFSSIASLIGSAGQGTYMAANAFLDALAQRRHAEGLPATTINWGPWAAGMLDAGSQFARRIMRDGMRLMSAEEGTAALGRILAAAPVQVGVLPVDWTVYAANRTEREIRPMLRDVIRAALAARPTAAGRDRSGLPDARGAGPGQADLEAIRSASGAEREARIAGYVRERARWVLGLDGDTPLGGDQNLFGLGLDSLMAVELAAALRPLAATIPTNVVFLHPTVDDLARQLQDLVPTPPGTRVAGAASGPDGSPVAADDGRD